MNANQIEVLQWWHSGRDYQTGVMLLTKLHNRKNNVLAQTLMKPGKEKFQKNHDKLHYELAKTVGLNWKKMPELPEGVTLPVATPAVAAPKPPEGEADGEKQVPLVSNKPIDQYPKIIRRLKFEYQEKYSERAQLHKKMQAVREENTSENMKVRADCLSDMKALSKQMDFLYGFIERYEKVGTIPTEEEVWPKENPLNPPEGGKKKKPLSAHELKKRKKNLQSANTKDRNQLQYQQNRKGNKDNPMPDGPKRRKLELRIKKREEEIEEIEMKLVELEK